MKYKKNTSENLTMNCIIFANRIIQKSKETINNMINKIKFLKIF